MSFNVCQKVGLELEGFTFDQNGQPVDVYSALAGGVTLPDRGLISTDAAPYQIEISTVPCQSSQELFDCLQACLEYLPPEWQFVWQAIYPKKNGYPPAWAPKRRYIALWQGLAMERPDVWASVRNIAYYSSLQFHFEIDPLSKEGLKVLNAINNLSPVIVSEAQSLVGIIPNERFYQAWQGWAKSERIPAYRLFESTEQLMEFWCSIPRLLYRDEQGNWWADTKTKPAYDDPFHCGTVWWDARPRFDLGTIEVRMLDSMPPSAIPKVLDYMLNFIERVLTGKEDRVLKQHDYNKLMKLT